LQEEACGGYSFGTNCDDTTTEGYTFYVYLYKDDDCTKIEDFGTILVQVPKASVTPCYPSGD
jgi:hypothetical protein